MTSSHSGLAADREALHSPLWYRAQGLRPRLNGALRVSRQQVRGEFWWVVVDPGSGRAQRFNEIAWRMLRCFDGQRTVDEVWRERLACEGEAAPTQDACIRLLRQAHAGGLLVGSGAADAKRQAAQRGQRAAQRRRAATNPLAFRVPLWDPERWLQAHAGLWALLRHPAVRLLGMAAALAGLVALLVQAAPLAQYGQQQIGQPRALLMLWLAYPLMKALHELAHAVAVKAGGGEVHEIGVSLLLLTPVPYVDASASLTFDSKRARQAVAAAGIWAEWLMASVALALWLLVEDGLLREACFAVVVIGGFSTLLVNGNPLLRFDGYHVLTETFELPNLASRSSRWWALRGQRLLSVRAAGFGPLARGERGWLEAYAPLAWTWQVLLMSTLVLLAAQHGPGLGLAMLGLALWLTVLRPLWRVLAWWVAAPALAGCRLRSAVLSGSAAAALLGALAWWPVSLRSHAPGLVWVPDAAHLRGEVEGQLSAVLVEEGAMVEAGTPLLQLVNERLQADAQRLRSALERAEVEQARLYAFDAGHAARVADELQRLHAELARLQRQEQALTVRAQLAGRVSLPGIGNQIGRWLPQGHAFGVVIPPTPPIVRTLVRDEDIGLVRGVGEGRPVRVELAGAGRPTLTALPIMVVPLATRELPSRSLGDGAAGPLATDPADSRGLTLREARFQIDLALTPGSQAAIGTRVLVTFDHGVVRLWDWLARIGRQLLLRHFPT